MVDKSCELIAGGYIDLLLRAPAAARAVSWTIPRLKIWASSSVHRVKLAVMCPRAVPTSSSRRGRAYSSSVSTAWVSDADVIPYRRPRESGGVAEAAGEFAAGHDRNVRLRPWCGWHRLWPLWQGRHATGRRTAHLWRRLRRFVAGVSNMGTRETAALWARALSLSVLAAEVKIDELVVSHGRPELPGSEIGLDDEIAGSIVTESLDGSVWPGHDEEPGGGVVRVGTPRRRFRAPVGVGRDARRFDDFVTAEFLAFWCIGGLAFARVAGPAFV